MRKDRIYQITIGFQAFFRARNSPPSAAKPYFSVVFPGFIPVPSYYKPGPCGAINRMALKAPLLLRKWLPSPSSSTLVASLDFSWSSRPAHVSTKLPVNVPGRLCEDEEGSLPAPLHSNCSLTILNLFSLHIDQGCRRIQRGLRRSTLSPV